MYSWRLACEVGSKLDGASLRNFQRISYVNIYLGVLTWMKISLKSSTGNSSSFMVAVQNLLDSFEKLQTLVGFVMIVCLSERVEGRSNAGSKGFMK